MLDDMSYENVLLWSEYEVMKNEKDVEVRLL